MLNFLLSLNMYITKRNCNKANIQIYNSCNYKALSKIPTNNPPTADNIPVLIHSYNFRKNSKAKI